MKLGCGVQGLESIHEIETSARDHGMHTISIWMVDTDECVVQRSSPKGEAESAEQCRGVKSPNRDRSDSECSKP